jgi:signal transduction histidine kinase
MEMISTTLWIGMGLVLIVVFVLIVINRSHYTNMLRNKRYWNKQIFEGKYGQIPTLICPDVVNSLDVGLNSLGDQARLGAAAARTASADALQNLANQTRNIGT